MGRWMMTGLLGMVMCLASCDSEIKTSDSDVQPLQREALDEMMADPGTVLVDVRKPELYRAGHIPGAMNIPFTVLRRDGRLDSADQIVVYAGGWTDPLSVAAAKRLIILGYNDVYEFKGGVELWQDSGGKLIKLSAGEPSRPESE